MGGSKGTVTVHITGIEELRHSTTVEMDRETWTQWKRYVAKEEHRLADELLGNFLGDHTVSDGEFSDCEAVVVKPKKNQGRRRHDP